MSDYLRIEDAPDGKAWKCPDCNTWLSLGHDAAEHAFHFGHGSPHLDIAPWRPDSREGRARRATEMISEACAALGIEPGGRKWRCEGCGEHVAPDANFGHKRAVDEHCGPISLEASAVDDLSVWREVLEAIRAKRAATEPLGWAIVDKNGRADHRAAGSPFFEDRDFADSFANSLNKMPGFDGPLTSHKPFRVVPVGLVVEAKPFGFGVIDKDGGALVQHVYRGRDTAEHSAIGLNQASRRMESPLPDAPFASVQLFYVSPPDRPAEAPTTEASEGESK